MILVWNCLCYWSMYVNVNVWLNTFFSLFLYFYLFLFSFNSIKDSFVVCLNLFCVFPLYESFQCKKISAFSEKVHWTLFVLAVIQHKKIRNKKASFGSLIDYFVHRKNIFYEQNVQKKIQINLKTGENQKINWNREKHHVKQTNIYGVHLLVEYQYILVENEIRRQEVKRKWKNREIYLRLIHINGAWEKKDENTRKHIKI